MEFALVTPLMVLLFIGALDAGLMILSAMRWQGSAQVVADLVARDANGDAVKDELRRSGCDSEPVILRDDPVVTVRLDCPYRSITTILPATVRVVASAVT